MATLPRPIQALPLLRQLKLDDTELIAALISVGEAGYAQTSERTYEIRSADCLIAEVRLNRNFQLTSVMIPSDVWGTIRPKISADAELNQTRIARTILFTYRPPTGYAQIPGWLQLRPVACDLKDATGLGLLSSNVSAGIPYPFAIEVVFRYSNLPLLEAHRRIRAVQEAIWLLSAFIDIAVFSFRSPFSWVFIDGCYQLARCGMSDGLETSSDLEFSNVRGLSALTPTSTEQYFRELGITSSEFRVPDLDYLYRKYTELSPEKKLSFLRSCASLSAACNPTIEKSLQVVSLVSAIEPLFEVSEKCQKCGNPTGITKQFKKFLDDYVQLEPAVRRLYERVYQARSNVVHGGWNFDVDEAILGIRPQGHTVPLAAWDATKRGIVQWLLSQ
jgi:hypothetical protein